MHDENEREALYAIMYAAASRGKGKKGELPKVEDLYPRPGTEERKQQEMRDMVEEKKRTDEWLKRLDLSVLTQQSGK
ncbi:hypothetical protein [Virgibacillus proomii]|uniref:hypothetical protein n=1 Tax=Virgibacillus proomii TaxID=84407 RepID=UPI001C1129E0|nr:hypothetical protein [Virgibacillus proomii]MBU5266301.1 hypothetical protein [Virgibacillus proomii]